MTHKSFAVRPIRIRFIAFLMGVSIITGCGRSSASSNEIPMTTVMQAIRDYGRGHVPASNSHATMLPEQPNSAPPTLENEAGHYAMLDSFLQQENYDLLERQAMMARTEQPRFSGGVWMLFEFYEGLGKPLSGSDPSDWDAHITAVKKWIAANPQSATAQIVLAKVYIERAWKTRGSGYVDTVSNGAWGSFYDNLATAKSVLLDAAKLKDKCPYWYEAMQIIALGEGWEKAQARELFDQASAFEPTYYHYYREYANFLLPKWHGENGETQAFAEEVLKRVNEPDASVIYYEIASLLACQCDRERDSLQGMSWPKVKEGYVTLVRRTGTSNLKGNRFAYMSFVADDRAAAEQPFSQIGDNWDHRVWRSQQNFETARLWALNP